RGLQDHNTPQKSPNSTPSLIKMNTHPKNHTWPFKCAISFNLFLYFLPNDKMTLDGFHKLVANKCDNNFSKIGRLILNGTKSDPPTITLSGYILKNKIFPKASTHRIFNTTSFQQWMTDIATSGHAKGGITICMDNPSPGPINDHQMTSDIRLLN
ncbi:hypothetical protein VP01_12440g1, partial [Puccinia sorghi]